MSKAKELATSFIDLYSRSKIWDMNIDSDISDMVYLAKDLSNAVLSEPDEPCGLKGWIQVTSSHDDLTILFRVDEIFSVSNNRIKVPKLETWGVSSIVECKESYEEIKQKIRESL